MATTFDVIYLGTFADLDPTEGNTATEDAGLLVGSTFGSTGDPLSKSIRTLTPVGTPGTFYNKDNTAPEQYNIDGTTHIHDGFADYTALVTFGDGTTAEVPINIFQTTTGDLYLAPNTVGEEDVQALLESQPIISLEVLSLDASGAEMKVDRLPTNYADQTVDGTAGHDDIRLGYTDTDGTAITAGDDTISGGAGNDTIEGAGGDDIIWGGTGSDSIYGDMGDGSTYGTLNLSVTDNLGDAGATETLNTRAVELVTLANGDLIMITSERTSASHDGIATWQVDNDPNSATYGQVISGQLDQIQEPTQPNGGAGYDAIEDISAITLPNGETYVFTADKDQDAIGIAKVNLDGTLTPQAALIDSVSLDEVQEVSIADVGGQPMLLALGGGTSDALVAYSINADGTLTQTDVEVDGSGAGENYLNNNLGTDSSLLESYTDGSGKTFVVAGGADNGISLWTLDGSGQLTFENARGDDQAGAGEFDPQGNELSRDVHGSNTTGLTNVDAAAFAEIDNKTYILVGGQDDDVSVFRIDPDTVNADGSFDLTLVGQIDNLATDISSMAVLETDAGPVLAVGGEQNTLEFHAISVDGGTGIVSLTPVGTVTEGVGGATELTDSEDIAVEGGLIVTASDNDNGVTLINSGLNSTAQIAGNDTISGGDGDDWISAGTGTDTVVGGRGSDTIIGGDGADIIFGDQAGGSVSYIVDSSGDLFTYNPVTNETEFVVGGLTATGDLAQTPDGQLYGVVFDSSSTTNAGVYRIDPATGVETLVHDLPEDIETYASLASDPNGNLYFSEDGSGSLFRLAADGTGGFTGPTMVGTVPLFTVDILFLDTGTAWAVSSGVIHQYDVDAAGHFTSETALGSVTSGGADIFGLTLGDDGRVYAFEGSGEVHSTDPTILPLSWTSEDPTTDTSIVWGATEMTVDGAGAGNDSIDGGAGDDTIHGGAGSDTVTGGAGADQIVFAEGDSIDGGSGDDVFILTDYAETGNGNITIDGGAVGETNGGGDTLDLGTLADLSTLSITNTYSNASGNTSQDGTVSLDDGSLLTFSNIETIICFASGSLIKTVEGHIPIENLGVGHMVLTRDNGPQPILWAGQRELMQHELAMAPHLKPIRLSARLFGLERDLIVSPQHGVLLRRQDRGGTEELYRAKHLAALKGGSARVMQGCRKVTYHHLMFASHQVINANGMWSESLYPGKMALSSLSRRSTEEILHLFPELRSAPVEVAYGGPFTPYAQPRSLPESTKDLAHSG